MSRLLLMLDHRENRRLLQEQLSERYDITIPSADQSLDEPFDLCVIDGPALERLWQRLLDRKAAEQPIFLPVLFVTARQDVRLVTRHLWTAVDELIIAPVERVELAVRIEILLRTRGLTLQLDESRRLQAQSEARYRAIGEALPYGIWTADPQGSLTYLSPAFVALADGAPGEAQRRGWAGIVAPEQREEVDAAWREAIRAGRGWDYELLVPAPDGEVRTVLSRGIPVRDGAGRIESWVGINLDISQRKQQTAELDRERAFFAGAFDILPFALAFIRADGQVIRANEAFGRLLQRLGAGSWAAVALLWPATHSLVPWEERPVVLALHGETLPAVELLARQADGGELPILVHAAPIYVGEQLTAAAVAVQDVSALKEADRAKDEFLAAVSHELLTPVTSIMGWHEIATRSPEVIPEALEVIKRSAERQQRLVEDLLDISRLRHGKFRLRPQRADLWQLAEQTLQDMEAAAQEREVVLQAQPPPGPLPLQADPARIRQAISNLLSNAIKFSDPGGVVTVSGHAEAGRALLQVTDRGRGIAPDQLARLFHPFQQLGERGQGLGLGLALVKGIVESHGGAVSAHSPGPGQGSTFIISLPLARVSSPEQEPTAGRAA